MRILAIRGANLASLAAPFEIDLAAEPLASAGLFAITGETGSGKSTILDAMCLALHGDCPRLSSGGINDDIPDASGEVIKSRDARAVLRRGAAAGYAEVDFVAPDGIAYRARWSARRARDKVDGRLRAVDRALIRISDGQVLESQITAVNARVAAITGLQYDEFRRTVLLAQGDFDAFLVAGTGERAALLEKVTGTRIYREISCRVYARHDAAKEALKALEDRRSGAVSLSDEDRAALVTEREARAAEIAAAAATLAEQGREIAAHERIAAARARVEGAAAAETAARAALTKAAPDRDKLTRLETALDLRNEHDRVARAEKALLDATDQRRAAEDHRSALAESEAEAGARGAAAETALAEAERVFKAFGPDWTRATELDGQIRTAAAECARAEAEDAVAGETAETRRAAFETLSRQREGEASKRDAARSGLAAMPGAARLAEAWEAISGLIDERLALLASADAERRAVEAARAAQTGAAERLRDLAAADHADRAAIFEHDAAVGLARARLGEIAAADLPAGLACLAETETAVKEMLRLAETHAEARGTRDAALVDLSAAQTALLTAETGRAAAEVEAARAGAAVAALAAPVDRAEAAASDWAAHLRGRLVAGEACPVCGATEHPVSAEAGLAELARDLRARLEAERGAFSEATRAGTDADRAAAAARLAITAAVAARDAAGDRIGKAEAAFAEARSRVGEADRAGLPAEPAQAGEALTILRGRIEARRRDFVALGSEERALRAAVERDHAAIAAHRVTLEGREAARATEETARTESVLALDRAERALLRAEARMRAIDDQISPIIKDIEGAPPLEDDPADCRRALEGIVTRYRDLRAACDTAEAAIVALGPEISAAEAARDGAGAMAKTARTTAEARRAALAELRAARAPLLGGEETETHRSRCNQARIDAQAARDAAWQALAALRADMAGADKHLTRLGEAIIDARREEAEARSDLDAKLGRVGLTRETLGALLAEGRAEADRLRARLREIDDALTRASTTATERGQDLRALIEAGVPEASEADLRAARDATETGRAEAQKRAGAIQGQLEADDAVRARLGDLDREIAAAKAVRDTWAAVNEAVGSARGDKFAQIAQSVTLAMLVERANQHLAELKPRYQLARGGADLALRIIDRHMGDEIRSTRSLSGGERFLVSLSLALALSRMGGQGGLAATLFIDEGFGALDAESLDVALDALEALRAQGRVVGVISHVDAMKDRIPTQVRVVRHGAGASAIEVLGGF
jgi:exonuclease SbcC